MQDRVYNFSAGPGALPLPVLETIRDELVSLPGVGASALEVSHRGRWFTSVIEEAEDNIRRLLDVPQSHRIEFCQGGATMQFSMAAMNFLRPATRPAEYVVTGSWGEKALREAEKEGPTRVVWSGKDEGYTRTPTTEELLEGCSGDAPYVHFTSNETIQGVEFPDTPIVPNGTPLIGDCSSDFLSRPTDVAPFGLMYAGAQKNAGPAGVTVAIIREDLLQRIPDGLPAMLDYRTYTEHSSLYNTPPVFSIYVLTLVTRWLLTDVGGLEKIHDLNKQKASLLYEQIDAAPSFYRGHAEAGSRSLMNVTFRLPTQELEGTFVAEAAAHGMVELKGHRSVGGIRASIYNSMPLQGAQALADFMRDFCERNAP
jgi:phosphoserine aminotransferase